MKMCKLKGCESVKQHKYYALGVPYRCLYRTFMNMRNVCVGVCVYVCVYVCMYVCICVCVCVCMYFCMRTCMYVCMNCVCIYLFGHG